MRILALLILATVAPLPLLAGQDEQTPEFVFPRHIFGDEASRLLKALASSPPIPIGFENADRSPLTIVGASAGAVSLQRPGESPIAIAENRYAVDARINLVNKTDKRIKGVKLEFTYENLRTRFWLEYPLTVEPYGSSIFGEPDNEVPELISLPMKPGRLSVKVLEVQFQNGTRWEVDYSADVDEIPAPLTRPVPKYTEEARRNRIQGPVRLRLLVGADGEVGHVEIKSGLPDGLDAEAVQTAYGLKFKPAMKAGKPVECWLLFDIVYNLPIRPSLTEIVSPKP